MCHWSIKESFISYKVIPFSKCFWIPIITCNDSIFTLFCHAIMCQYVAASEKLSLGLSYKTLLQHSIQEQENEIEKLKKSRDRIAEISKDLQVWKEHKDSIPPKLIPLSLPVEAPPRVSTPFDADCGIIFASGKHESCVPCIFKITRFTLLPFCLIFLHFS